MISPVPSAASLKAFLKRDKFIKVNKYYKKALPKGRAFKLLQNSFITALYFSLYFHFLFRCTLQACVEEVQKRLQCAKLFQN